MGNGQWKKGNRLQFEEYKKDCSIITLTRTSPVLTSKGFRRESGNSESNTTTVGRSHFDLGGQREASAGTKYSTPAITHRVNYTREKRCAGWCEYWYYLLVMLLLSMRRPHNLQDGFIITDNSKIQMAASAEVPPDTTPIQSTLQNTGP